MSDDYREGTNGLNFSKEEPERTDGQQGRMPEEKVDTLYLIRQIEKVLNQTDYLHEAMENLARMSDGESSEAYAPGNLLGQAKANAFKDIVCYRETTNQQVLRMYEKMYDDLQDRRTFEEALLDYLQIPAIRPEEKLQYMQRMTDILCVVKEIRTGDE